MQEKIALKWMVVMSLLANCFKYVPGVFVKCAIKDLFFAAELIDACSNDGCLNHTLSAIDTWFFLKNLFL